MTSFINIATGIIILGLIAAWLAFQVLLCVPQPEIILAIILLGISSQLLIELINYCRRPR